MFRLNIGSVVLIYHGFLRFGYLIFSLTGNCAFAAKPCIQALAIDVIGTLAKKINDRQSEMNWDFGSRILDL